MTLEFYFDTVLSLIVFHRGESVCQVTEIGLQNAQVWLNMKCVSQNSHLLLSWKMTYGRILNGACLGVILWRPPVLTTWIFASEGSKILSLHWAQKLGFNTFSTIRYEALFESYPDRALNSHSNWAQTWAKSWPIMLCDNHHSWYCFFSPCLRSAHASSSFGRAVLLFEKVVPLHRAWCRGVCLALRFPSVFVIERWTSSYN
jgi:hypothetical protein